MPILFCNVAWMERYRGPEPDKISGGGSWVEERNRSYEEYNFFDRCGYYGGYVSTRGNQMKIERLGADEDDDFIDDILVVWTAKHPDDGGTKIIGWYKDARVYREYQELEISGVYNIAVKVEDSLLLTVEKRLKDVPRASKAGAGRGMGQSNYWYADDPRAKDFIEEAKDYISNYDGPQLDNKKSSLTKLEEAGFELEDEVKIKEGFMHPEFDNLSLGGWTGQITFVTVDQQNKLLIYVKFDEETVKNMPKYYIEDSKEKNLNHAVFVLYVEDIERK